MLALKGLKLYGELRRLTDLRPVTRNATRWSSTSAMVRRYFLLKPYLTDIETHPELIDFVLSPRECNNLSNLHGILTEMDSVTKALQKEDLDLKDTRILFDEIIRLYP